MAIFIGIVAWIITGVTTESSQVGFFFGLVVAVLYKQHIQISDLIAQRSSYKKSETLSPKPVIALSLIHI